MHTPYQRINGSDTIIICIHGIQGSPSQFAWLTDSLPEDVDYLSLLLPGHGAGVKEFSRSGCRDWMDFVIEAVRSVSRNHRHVIYVGHSMGCLLGILAASEGHFNPDGMLLLACPLSLRPTLRYASNNWKAVTQSFPSSPWIQAARDANSVAADHPFAYLTCAKPYLGLLKLICMARKALTNLRTPVIALHSELDEIVGNRSLELLRSRAQAKTHILPDSGHFLYSAQAKKKIFHCLHQLINP